jgi:hypothetical protein
MGIFVIPIRMVLGSFFMEFIARDAATPMTVAMRADNRAMVRVVDKAFMMSSSRNSSEYQFKVKPPHLERDLEALKDKIINMKIGAYKKINISPK